MFLGTISRQFPQQVETVTGLPVHLEADKRLQPPLLAKLQIARRGVPLHRGAYHPSARAIADYLIAFQCSFILRLYSMQPPERFDFANAPVAQPDPMKWARAHAASAHLPPGRQCAFVAPSHNDSDWLHKDDDVRWQFSVPPKGNANFAWVQHLIHHPAPQGMAGFVLANGSMSSDQSGEGDNRHALIKAALVDCIVVLRGQVLYRTRPLVCLWFLAKNKAADAKRGFRDRRQQTLFIDACKLGTLINLVPFNFSNN